MQDTELYRHVLGPQAPWRVDNVELDVRKQPVDIWAIHIERRQDSMSRTFPKSQLREGHAEELIETGKAFDLVVAAVSLDVFSELMERQEIHDPGKDGWRGIHRSLPAAVG